MTTVTGNGHLFTANQGDADQREENREAHNKRAIHLESSKVTQVPETTNFLPSSLPETPWPRRQAVWAGTFDREIRIQAIVCWLPCVSLCGLGSLNTNAQSRVLG
jgi:hypothetical protein